MLNNSFSVLDQPVGHEKGEKGVQVTVPSTGVGMGTHSTVPSFGTGIEPGMGQGRGGQGQGAQGMGGMGSWQDPAVQSPAAVWVVRYVDYTSKYGLGFLFNTGSAGVYFNDSTKIVLNASGTVFQYTGRCHMYHNNRHNYTQLYTIILNIHTNDAYYYDTYDTQRDAEETTLWASTPLRSTCSHRTHPSCKRR
jgi:hypothetical protein